MKRKVDFVACDMPSANAFMINVYAAVAQEERRMISERTAYGQKIETAAASLQRLS
jgi:DNA invertase Pin-like site-specific DNA recombinase